VSFFAKLSVRSKLLLNVALLVAGIVVVGFFGQQGTSKLTARVVGLNKNQFAAARDVADAQVALMQWNRSLLRHYLNDDPAKKATHEQAMKDHAKTVTDKLSAVTANKSLMEQTRTDAQALIDALPDIERVAGESIKVSNEQGGDEGYKKAAVEVVPLVNAEDEKMAKLLDWVNERVGVIAGETQAQGAAVTRQIVIVAVIASLLGIGLGMIIAMGISGRARELAEQVKTLADGDLTQRVAVKSTDELGQLGAALNSSRDNLQSLVRDVADAAGSVAEASQQVAASANDSARGAQEVSNTIEQVARGAESQTEGLASIRDQMTTLRDAVAQVAKGAEEQVRVVESSMGSVRIMTEAVEEVGRLALRMTEASGGAATNAEAGAKAVSEGVRAMQRIRENVAESTSMVENLSKRSEAIGEIVSVIEDVSEQTNLLALNAAIEAARAGEHGKGFAVVADEVRKLAERAASSTGQITALIKQIQTEISAAVRAQEQGSKETEEGAMLVERAGESLNSILASSQEVASMATSVSSASSRMEEEVRGVVGAMEMTSAATEENSAAAEQMTASAIEVVRAVDSVAAIAEESSAATEEVSASSEEQTAAAEEIAATSEELTASAESLQALVSRFKV
jgi:methyl-accepting chemotaxis protein